MSYQYSSPGSSMPGQLPDDPGEQQIVLCGQRRPKTQPQSQRSDTGSSMPGQYPDDSEDQQIVLYKQEHLAPQQQSHYLHQASAQQGQQLYHRNAVTTVIATQSQQQEPLNDCGALVQPLPLALAKRDHRPLNGLPPSPKLQSATRPQIEWQPSQADKSSSKAEVLPAIVETKQVEYRPPPADGSVLKIKDRTTTVSRSQTECPPSHGGRSSSRITTESTASIKRELEYRPPYVIRDSSHAAIHPESHTGLLVEYGQKQPSKSSSHAKTRSTIAAGPEHVYRTSEGGRYTSRSESKHQLSSADQYSSQAADRSTTATRTERYEGEHSFGGRARKAASTKGDAEVRHFEQKVQRIILSVGACPKGFDWYNMGDGYLCAGGNHSIDHEEIDKTFDKRNYRPRVEIVNTMCDPMLSVRGKVLAVHPPPVDFHMPMHSIHRFFIREALAGGYIPCNSAFICECYKILNIRSTDEKRVYSDHDLRRRGYDPDAKTDYRLGGSNGGSLGGRLKALFGRSSEVLTVDPAPDYATSR